jgi:alanine racemase
MTLEGLYTHFAAADEADKSFSESQIRRFSEFVASVQKPGLEIPLIHAGNSAGTIDLPHCHFTMVRPGISAYGCHASDDMHTEPDLRPVMRVKGYITIVKNIAAGSFIGYGCTYRAEKNMTTAIVPMGYADGYDRRLANSGKVLIAGRMANVLGRISMDQIVVDVTDLAAEGSPPVPGDEVILIDNQPASPNSAQAIARQIGTISYEVLTQLGRRVLRIAVDTEFEK